MVIVGYSEPSVSTISLTHPICGHKEELEDAGQPGALAKGDGEGRRVCSPALVFLGLVVRAVRNFGNEVAAAREAEVLAVRRHVLVKLHPATGFRV